MGRRSTQARSRPTDLHRRTGTSAKMTRLRGRVPRGERLIGKIPHGHWKTTTFVAGLCSTVLTTPCVIDGAMTAGSSWPISNKSWCRPLSQTTSSCWTISAPTRCRGYVKRSKPQCRTALPSASSRAYHLYRVGSSALPGTYSRPTAIGAKRPLADSISTDDAPNLARRDFSHSRSARRPVGRRINDDLHPELAEGSHPRHLRKLGFVVDGNREM
jgi:hypothetical protein